MEEVTTSFKRKKLKFWVIILFAFLSLFITFCVIFLISKTKGGTVLNEQITQRELDQGWYYGELNQKKFGTPDSWIHSGEGTKSSMWHRPETETSQINKEGYITEQELNQGWYYGDENQKKQGTPDSWVHVGEGTRSAMWKKPDLNFGEENTSIGNVESCYKKVTNVECTPPGTLCMTNPASTFCECMGGSIKIVNNTNGPSGICSIKGQQIDEWEYYRNQTEELTKNQY